MWYIPWVKDDKTGSSHCQNKLQSQLFFSPLHLVCFRHFSCLFLIFNIMDLLLNTGIEYIEQIFMILNNRKTKPIDRQTIKKHDHISGMWHVVYITRIGLQYMPEIFIIPIWHCFYGNRTLCQRVLKETKELWYK